MTTQDLLSALADFSIAAERLKLVERKAYVSNFSRRLRPSVRGRARGAVVGIRGAADAREPLVIAIALAATLGLSGGLLPAIRAARGSIAATLHEK